jgi:hypothetical protein
VFYANSATQFVCASKRKDALDPAHMGVNRIESKQNTAYRSDLRTILESAWVLWMLQSFTKHAENAKPRFPTKASTYFHKYPGMLHPT